MTLLPTLLFLSGVLLECLAVVTERRMQRHRLPGISYWAATLRLDGGWRRADLFAPEGLLLQRQASRFALWGVVLWALAAVGWVFVLQFR